MLGKHFTIGTVLHIDILKEKLLNMYYFHHMSELLYNTVPNKYLDKVFAFSVSPVQNL